MNIQNTDWQSKCAIWNDYNYSHQNTMAVQEGMHENDSERGWVGAENRNFFKTRAANILNSFNEKAVSIEAINGSKIT